MSQDQSTFPIPKLTPDQEAYCRSIWDECERTKQADLTQVVVRPYRCPRGIRGCQCGAEYCKRRR